MIRKTLLLLSAVLVLSVSGAEGLHAQRTAPGHVPESLTDEEEDGAYFLYGFYMAYMHSVIYAEQLGKSICKAAFTRKALRKMNRVAKQSWSDPIIKGQDCPVWEIETIKVEPVSDGWYEVSFQPPYTYDRYYIHVRIKKKGQHEYRIADIKTGTIDFYLNEAIEWRSTTEQNK